MFRLLILATLLIGSPALAADSFFQWIDDTGTICYTDDIDRIPEKYFDRADERTWVELRETTNERWTIDNG